MLVLDVDFDYSRDHDWYASVENSMKPLVLKAIQRPIVPDEIQVQAGCCTSFNVRLTRPPPVS